MINQPFSLRTWLLALVIGLPLLVLLYAVTMGGAALFAVLGDEYGALGLRWIATVLALLFVSGCLALLLLLGWIHLERGE